MTTKQERIPQQSPLKIPVIWVVIIGLVVIATIFATLFFSRSGREKGLVAGTENLRPVSGTENLQLVNPNWDKQKPVTAPVVVPAIRSDFKAEYKEITSARGKIEFKFVPADTGAIRYTIKNKSDVPIFMREVGEQKDISGKIIDRLEPGWFLLKPGESTGGARLAVEPETKILTMWVEVKSANGK